MLFKKFKQLGFPDNSPIFFTGIGESIAPEYPAREFLGQVTSIFCGRGIPGLSDCPKNDYHSFFNKFNPSVIGAALRSIIGVYRPGIPISLG